MSWRRWWRRLRQGFGSVCRAVSAFTWPNHAVGEAPRTPGMGHRPAWLKTAVWAPPRWGSAQTFNFGAKNPVIKTNGGIQ